MGRYTYLDLFHGILVIVVNKRLGRECDPIQNEHPHGI
jgi:hypothetical protein